MPTIYFDCPECGELVTLDVEEQKLILAQLTRPAHCHVHECKCKRYQGILAARRVGNREVQR